MSTFSGFTRIPVSLRASWRDDEDRPPPAKAGEATVVLRRIRCRCGSLIEKLKDVSEGGVLPLLKRERSVRHGWLHMQVPRSIFPVPGVQPIVVTEPTVFVIDHFDRDILRLGEFSSFRLRTLPRRNFPLDYVFVEWIFEATHVLCRRARYRGGSLKRKSGKSQRWQGAKASPVNGLEDGADGQGVVTN